MIVTSVNLSEAMVRLSELGDVSLSMIGVVGPRGWHASVSLPAPAGCEAKVRSTFDHRTPESALQQLVDRLEALRGSSLAEQSANPKLKLVSSR
jgi:hypothetical protein